MRPSKALYLLAANSLCISTAVALDRTRSQFKHWFPTIEQFAKHRFEDACPEQYANYFNESLPDENGAHVHSQALMNCILEEYGELNMAGMAVTAILLALLPSGLVQFGPSMAEISILSTRRPVLATLLGFGLMSPNPTEFEYEEILEKASNGGAPLIPIRALDGRYFIAKVLISLVEYIIAMTAAGNLFYQVYRFTYQSISLAPLMVYLYGLPEAATLFGWASLNLPLYLLSFGVFALAFRRVRPKSGYSRGGNRLMQLITTELTPCGQGRDLKIERRPNRQFLQQFLGMAVRLFSGLHIIVGTVLIGSIVLIPIADSLPLIYSFVFAAIFTRAVLSFELNGLARKTTIVSTGTAGQIDNQVYETHALEPKRYNSLGQSD
ncbi:hypothetical protein FVEN_g8197 [Fusarium venenatum]|uniref:ABC transmembrane type-1 domain-containing protein n=1 Tax=Fusarium venenatum TaxID=56646 RepID=A0A2L2SUF5_9HYPO|nr:uncharacterized protein FVRRES_04434 [Fusarium venenatum]KAG8353828.1 hypothetical protein FVEN_g8197 [Fusarium venenatum]KAH6991603.1 hypothetical protein EDB82DRAFT_573474 [Fusarium venenatum]CEI59998.1 unnamed protein product [Fusarium venenatum]